MEVVLVDTVTVTVVSLHQASIRPPLCCASDSLQVTVHQLLQEQPEGVQREVFQHLVADSLHRGCDQRFVWRKRIDRDPKSTQFCVVVILVTHGKFQGGKVGGNLEDFCPQKLGGMELVVEVHAAVDNNKRFLKIICCKTYVCEAIMLYADA